ncbi:MAG TPA: oxidoreductase [Candidatus Acidoferrales bacterium]|nr:oxidoreductase [Candidatus Acidoferrales bacterium]
MSIRVALIGYGYAGKTFHAPLIAATPGLELTLVGSSDAPKVQADLPGIRVVGDPRAAATDVQVDLVVVATPNDTHAPLATAALEAHKDVVVEKPFALTLAEAQRLAALAKERGRVLSVFHNRRWDSDFLGARAALDDDRLGDVVHFESHFDRFRPVVRDRWRERAVPGGGILYDLGPHLIDQALQLFGMPANLSADSARQRAGTPIEDWVHLVLDYGRLRVILHASMLVAGGARRMVLHGTKGSWIKQHEDVQEKQLVAGMRPGAPGWGIDPDSATIYDGSTAAEVPVPPGDYRNYYAALRDAVLGQGPNPVPPAEAVAVMQMLEQGRL